MFKLTALLLMVLPSLILISACEKTQPKEMPPAQTLTNDANGYYCLMTVVNHKGPKGQIILSDQPQSLWFTSVRDTIAFTRSPEEPKNIAAIYVNDMSDADWDNPGSDNWIVARTAWYVLGSDVEGGMGAPEAVPFSSKEKAALFASKKGGTVYAFKMIPHDFTQ